MAWSADTFKTFFTDPLLTNEHRVCGMFLGGLLGLWYVKLGVNWSFKMGQSRPRFITIRVVTKLLAGAVAEWCKGLLGRLTNRKNRKIPDSFLGLGNLS